MSHLEDRLPHSDDGTVNDRPLGEVGHVLYQGLEALASLKFTVALFGLAIFLILAGTLAQVRMDISEVLREYFRPWIAMIDVQVFFPPSFFADPPQVSGKLPFPGGATIGTLLFLNLLAAHGIRFKVQARGSRLWAGLGVMALGVFVTYIVIASGSNKDGVQGEPLLSWNVLWQCLKYGLGVLWVGMASSLLKIKSDRTLERGTIVTLTVLLGAGLVYLFYQGDELALKPESMRILWQLIKATFAALVLLGGCVLLFKKRAGVVLLHGGVGLMMFSELMVSLMAKEAQMPIFEGQTVNYVQNIEKFELAFIDRSPKDHDRVAVIPASLLIAAAADETVIEDERLPVKLKVRQYMQNSEFSRETGDVSEIPKRTGTESKVNAPSAYLELLDKQTDESLGEYLVSLHLKAKWISVGNSKYTLDLRFQRTYKPYSMHLIDVKADKYIGTDTPSNYSSELRLVDKSRNVDRRVRIWMNNPLRFAGETFYQSGYAGPPDVPVEQTTLQVVTNAGWMTPYVACMIVFWAMLFHFWFILLRFLNRRNTGHIGASEIGGAPAAKFVGGAAAAHRPARTTPTEQGADSPIFETSFLSAERCKFWFPAIIGVLVVGWLGSKLQRASTERPTAAGYNLKSFGKLPVVYEGRMKPMDSLARNTLRGLSGRQKVEVSDDETLLPLEWLLNHATHPDKADRYRVITITNLDILNMLGLPRRKGYRYSYNEVLKTRKENAAELDKQVEQAREKNSKERNVFERKVLDLWGRISTYWKVRYAFRVPPKDVGGSQEELLANLLEFDRKMESAPRSVPVPDGRHHWQSLTSAGTRLWIRRFARAKQLKTLDEVSAELLKYVDRPEVTHRLGPMVRANVILQILDSHKDSAAVRQMIRTAERQEMGRAEFIPFAEKELRREMPRLYKSYLGLFARSRVRDALKSAMAGGSLHDDDPPELVALVDAVAAYRDGDAEGFNTAVAAYQARLDEIEPERYDRFKLSFEAKFNAFEPYYNSSLIYLAAFLLAAAAWFGWGRPLNRASLLLIALAFAMHSVSLVSRMYITGRWGVTVTNLYSSAIFIGWAGVLLGMILEVVYRIGIGNIIASTVGFGTLLIAHFLSLEGDTMKVLQAVLDTDFWLATHVTTITLGYATTYVAGLLGLVYIIRGLATPFMTVREGKDLNRMIYGTLCFAIFFSFVGTVLGGLWADDSWGRFWGWDPKENGALIIVLWNAIVLHARWGGMVKDRGMAVLAVAGNIVTSWSWFGVNLLGAGLHSYGFQDGVGAALMLFVASQLAFIGLGCAPKELWWSLRRQEEPTA